MIEKDSAATTRAQYESLMKNYKSSNYFKTDWELRDGIYRQYTVFKDDCPSTSGTINSVKSI